MSGRYRIGDGELDDIERKITQDVRHYGWHVMGVLPTATTQEFAYSIGVYQSFNHPEIAVFGIPFREAHPLINTLVKMVQSGQRLETARTYSGVLDSASCVFVSSNPIWYEACFGRAVDFYGSLDFPVLQCVWSDSSGRFPWDRGFDTQFSGLQPNLTASPGPVAGVDPTGRTYS